MVRKVYEGFLKKDLASKKVSKSLSDTEIESINTKTKDKEIIVKNKPKVVAPFAPKSNPSELKTKTKIKKVGKPKIALFVDIDNVGISRENLLELLFFVNGKYKIEVFKLYGYDENSLPGIKEVASDYNLTTLGKMQFKSVGKNVLDSRLLIDAYDCAIKNQDNIDTIFVWCYPCDLSNLFEKITELGISTATIDNSLFDCKNKFVSQVIKLYSKYEFSVDDYMYGSLNTVQTAVNTKQENIVTKNEVVSEPTIDVSVKTKPVAEETHKPIPQNIINPIEKKVDVQTSASKVAVPGIETLDGNPIPVLPRRTIPERTGKLNVANKSLDTESQDSNLSVNRLETKNPPIESDLKNPISDESANTKEDVDDDKVSLLDILKDIIPMEEEQKEKKYEDTIGDL